MLLSAPQWRQTRHTNIVIAKFQIKTQSDFARHSDHDIDHCIDAFSLRRGYIKGRHFSIPSESNSKLNSEMSYILERISLAALIESRVREGTGVTEPCNLGVCFLAYGLCRVQTRLQAHPAPSDAEWRGKSFGAGGRLNTMFMRLWRSWVGVRQVSPQKWSNSNPWRR